ncbi:MAG: NUDIX hydrolase [Lentisphaerae bacterium]|nr:NUDIX hydrolase [Lentisphaerota bacterium]
MLAEMQRLWHLFYRAAHQVMRVARFFGVNPRGAFVAVWQGRNILILKTTYQAFFTLPGGMASYREEPLANALREVAEEVGLTLRTEDLVLVTDSPHQARLNREHLSLFEVHLPAALALKTDPKEIAWAGFVPQNDPRIERMWSPFRAYVQAATHAA